jgi:hypothetical protein
MPDIAKAITIRNPAIATDNPQITESTKPPRSKSSLTTPAIAEMIAICTTALKSTPGKSSGPVSQKIITIKLATETRTAARESDMDMRADTSKNCGQTTVVPSQTGHN